MSYLSTSENVGFSGIPQNISDASCATQYKMAVESVPGSCGDVNMYIHDSSGDEQTYITHLNDNYFHTKFKIDPNELYTFHDSDVIAGEITVSHTEDNYIFTDNDTKPKLLDSPDKEIDLVGSLTNGEIKEELKTTVISNGHYTQTLCAPEYQDVRNVNINDSKITNTKVSKAKTPSQGEERTRTNTVFEIRRPGVHSPKGQGNNAAAPSNSSKASIISDNDNATTSSNVKSASTPKSASLSETFLDVFKREQGVVESSVVVKTETPGPRTPVATKPTPLAKKTSAGKAPSQPKARRGRGPAVHEALQRIPQKRAIAVPCRSWHAPGEELFTCGPLDDKQQLPFTWETSSSDDDSMPDFGRGIGPVCVEESAAESRGARLALRRAALRRFASRAKTTLQLSSGYQEAKELATLIKKQMSGKRPCLVPTPTVNHLLAKRGMSNVLTSKERRRLREHGWSGGESGSTLGTTGPVCIEELCDQTPLPCTRYCLNHVTLEPEQRLYAACAAVFAGGSRCMQPLLPLHDQTPLCTEHAWKRDNYDKLSRDNRPKKAVAVRPVSRKRAWAPPPRPPPRRAKRRRRPPPRPKPTAQHSLSEINVCSNSSTYDSSEDTTMGGLSENEYIASSSNDIEVVVGQVPADDILDPSVLSQIPDVAFTEFFNQAEGASEFSESSELTAALEAVLDERPLDVIDFQTHHNNKEQQVPAVSMQPSAPS